MLFQAAHQNPMGGHLKVDKTFKPSHGLFVLAKRSQGCAKVVYHMLKA